MKRFTAVLITAPLALGLVACGGDEEATTEDTTTTTVARSGDTATPGVTVTEAWARTSPSMAEAGAVYMTLVAGSDDALVGVSVDESVAARAEIHETRMADEDAVHGGGEGMGEGMGDGGGMGEGMSEGEGMGEGHGGGAMKMAPVDRIDMSAGEAVVMKPGGYHIMLMNLTEPLAAGTTFDLTLEFENAGEKTVPVMVREA